MTIVKYNPSRGLFSIPQWFEDVDDNFFAPAQRGLKIREDEKNIIVEAVVAGVPADMVEINIEDGILTIKAEQKESKETDNEFRSSSYQYYYTTALTGGEWQKTEAVVEHGVVTVTIPKAESAKPKKVTVKTRGK